MNFEFKKLFALVVIAACLIQINLAMVERILAVNVPSELTGY